VEAPFTAAWSDKLVRSRYPSDCDYVKDNLRARSRADAINLMPESFRLKLGSCSRLPQMHPWPKGHTYDGAGKYLGPNPYSTQQ